MTDIAIARDLTPATLEEIERKILQAEAEGDADTLAQYVPQHEAYYALVGAGAAIQRALDDWRIVHFGLYEKAGCTSANQYFVQQIQGNAHAQAPSTRLGNARALEFFYHEQGWSVEELFIAGIEKLRRWVRMAESVARNGNGFNAEFRDCILDPDVPVADVATQYQVRVDSSVPETQEVCGNGKWMPVVYSYSEPKSVNVNGAYFELVEWIPTDDGHVAHTVGYICAEAAETWQRVVEGKARLVAR